ncbi:MAG: ABC transporter substrate-binding protein [Acidimicrobiia bacterium]|nr:ABC transporter substrate-binding protein [Acidimicrobiia bacterium]
MSPTVILALLAALLMACTSEPQVTAPADAASGVRIGSFDFAESELLAELYAQVLESNELPVVRLGVIGPREIVAPAIEGGFLDVVPEYGGTAARHYATGLDGGAALTTGEMFERRGLTLLDPAPAENVNVFVMTLESASVYGLERISDLSTLAGTLRLGGPVECTTRPLCLPGLADVYGLQFAEFVPMRSLSLTAEALRRHEIDVGVMFSTAAELSAELFVILTDDRRLQPEEHLAPLVRLDAIDRWGPDLVDGLNELSGDLTTDEVRRLNRAIADGTPPATVAKEWLASRTEHGQQNSERDADDHCRD